MDYDRQAGGIGMVPNYDDRQHTGCVYCMCHDRTGKEDSISENRESCEKEVRYGSFRRIADYGKKQTD